MQASLLACSVCSQVHCQDFACSRTTLLSHEEVEAVIAADSEEEAEAEGEAEAGAGGKGDTQSWDQYCQTLRSLVYEVTGAPQHLASLEVLGSLSIGDLREL